VRRIDCRKTGGHARVYPHNERSGDGVIPSAWDLDEGHLHPDMRLYRLWKGKYRKRRGVGMGISTAGEPTSEFEELRAKWLAEADQTTTDGPLIRAITKSTCIHDYAVRDRSKADDFEVVAQANPLSLIGPDELREKRAEPEMTQEHWLRRTCNIAARESGQAILADIWDGLKEEGLEADAGAIRYGFVDLGWEIDTTAIGILAWENEYRRLIVGVKIFEPPVDEADVVAGLTYLQQEFAPKVWVVDPNASGKHMVQQLDKGTHPDQGDVRFDFAFHTQDNAPMCLAAIRFDEAVRNGWIRHDGHPGLRKHVMSAVKKPAGPEKWRYARPKEAESGRARAQFPTDALIGAAMAHSVAVEDQERLNRRAVLY
jgi:phage terminase large subunit-like protein